LAKALQSRRLLIMVGGQISTMLRFLGLFSQGVCKRRVILGPKRT
jgi:hypothetical protein